MFIWKIRKRSETKFWFVKVLTKAEFDQDWAACRIWWWHQDLAERFPTSDKQRSPHNHDVMMMRRMRRIMITIITLFMIMQTSSWWSDHWEDDGQMHQDHGRQQSTQLQWSGISSMSSRSSECAFSQCLVKHCIVFSHNISYPFPKEAVVVWLLCTLSDIVIFEEPEERTRGWWDVLSRRVAPSQAPDRISALTLLPGFCNLD